MSPSENRITRIFQIILLLLVLLLLYAGFRTWRGHHADVLIAPPPITPPPTPPMVPIASPPPLPSKPVPSVPVPKIIRKPPIKKPVRVVPISPAIPVMPPATPVPYQSYVPSVPPPPEPQEWKGTDTSIQHEGQIVVRNDEQWSRFWVEHHPGDFAPEVDFTHNMVIGIFVGSRPADQFSVSIVNVNMQPDAVVVDYRERNPPTGTFSMGVSVYPYVIKVIPKSSLHVKFNKLLPEQP